ncbi:MAG TPA: hypothetical protein PLP29_04995 [Candidatus Ozemobacteraceae bacterium]|nr:hypothetical protein [Candidatus Ozemobacteraceae bacterium]
MSSYYDRIDLSDVRWFFIGCILLLVPILYLFFSTVQTPDEQEFSSHAIESRTSAFDILPSRSTSSSAGTGPVIGGVMAHIEQKQSGVEKDLDRAWAAIQSAPRDRRYPQEMAPEAIQMSEVAENPELIEGNASLDQGNLSEAERFYKSALSQAQDNAFLEVEALGGLMEVYKRQGNVAEFVKAFRNYALAAQKLRNVYGPVADNVARAAEMFAQLAKVDPGRLREELVKGNLAMGTNVDVSTFMKAVEEARKLYPADLPDSESVYPNRPGG